MPENAPPLYDLFQSTRTRCGAVSKWISGRISAILDFLPLRRPNFSPLEQPLRRSLSNFVRENTSCQIVPYMDVIEIVSSEDEDDIEVEDDEFNDMHYSDTDTGQWLSTELFGAMRDELGPQSYDYASVRQVSFPRSASDATSTNQHSKRSLPSSFQKSRSKTNVALLGSHGGPTLNTAQKEILLLDDDHQTESTSYAQDSRSHEKLKQDASKRVFPSSFQPIAKLGSKIPSESKSTSDFDWMSRAYHGSTHNRQGALPYSFNNGKFIASTSGNSSCLNSYNGDFKDKFSRPGFNGAYSTSTSDRFGSHRLISEKIQGMPRSSAERRDDYYAYGTPGVSRVLPSSMLQGKYNNFQKSGFNDAEQHLGHGEDRGTDHGERLIFQQALQNLNQPKIEDDLPDGLLAVPLLKHQKIALAWMVKKEQGAVCTGGILADDQGLGKTISMIALIQKQRSEQLRHVSGDSNDKNLEALNIDDDDEGLCQPVEKQMPTEADYNKHDILGSSSKYIPLDVKMIPTRSDDTQHAKVASKLKCSSCRSRLAGGTLVVCPASILRQWARELDEKIPEGGKLSVLVYHGGSRTKHAHDLTKYDVVLTTYAIVVNEVPKQSNTDDSEINEKDAGNYGLAPEFCAKNKRKQKNNDRKKQKKKPKGLDDSNLEISGGALARVRWFRVILDEAQTIKNFRTLVASACCSLRAKRRWCLSGTPIQNTVDDLFSYFRFLKFEPYDSFGQFSLLIKHPISRDPVNGYKKLQAVLKTMLLRRTKGTLIDGQPVLKLPPKSIDLVKIDFEHEEREFYSSLEADTRKKFKAFDDAGTVSQNYASILVLLLRLRQACDHPFLVNSRARSDTISKESSSIVKQLPKDMVINLLNHLEGSSAICVLCSDPPEDPVVSMCGHVFCYQCVSDRLTGEDNSCPSSGCRNTLGADLVFSKSTLRSCSFDNFDTKALANFSSFNEEHLVTSCSFVSSKIRAAIGILNKLSSSNSEASLQNITGRCSPVRKHNYIDDSSSDANATSSSLNSNPGVPFKAIVFSQWTGMLDLLEQSLNQELIQYRRLDGSMPLHLRDMAVKEFNTDPEVVVMLMSLKAGCLGLNMVAACHVILLDLWWNPTTEDQAIDRAHRIGQTRPVTVSRLTITNTVEDRILALQESKRNMVASCFGEDASGGHASRLTVDDLRFLFNG